MYDNGVIIPPIRSSTFAIRMLAHVLHSTHQAYQKVGPSLMLAPNNSVVTADKVR